MREIIQTVYTFDELSEKAKNKAIEWYREHNDTDLSFARECIVNDVESNIFNIPSDFFSLPKDLWFEFSVTDISCIDTYYGYSRFELHYEHDSLLKALINSASQWSNHLKSKLCDLVHEGCIYQPASDFAEHAIESKFKSNGYITKHIIPDLEHDLKVTLEIMRNDITKYLVKALASEEHYINSDEGITEQILSNGYEFFEDGDFYR